MGGAYPMKTIALRFRDLSIPDGETVKRHRQRIQAHGCVWWGWMMRQREMFPDALLQGLAHEASQAEKHVFLYHSGECSFYPAILTEIAAYPGGAKILTPEVQKTPSYMAEAECPAWYRLTAISDPLARLENASIVGMPTLCKRSQADETLLGSKLND